MNACRFATMPFWYFRLVSRAGLDSNACTLDRVPRFPRNVRRLAGYMPRECAWFSWRGESRWHVVCENAAGMPARATDKGCRTERRARREGRMTLAWSHQDRCGTHRAERAWWASAVEQHRRNAHENAYRNGPVCEACGGRGIPADWSPLAVPFGAVDAPPACPACVGFGHRDGGRANAASHLAYEKYLATQGAAAE